MPLVSDGLERHLLSGSWGPAKVMTLSNTDVDMKEGAAAFVQSALFARTFREGMALVEETANYLDGEGRDAAKELGREEALAYASASMRLTTQLMQIASWLLVLRAVREDEMPLTKQRRRNIGSNAQRKRRPCGTTSMRFQNVSRG